MSLKVTEIFHSIQGESSFAGWPCVFIRLTGCNLRCSYCDTPYAYEEGEDKTIPEILKATARYRTPLVEVTGGEPLLQKETPLLLKRLLERRYTVLLETNGSLDISQVPKRCVRIVDIKCPSSGMSRHNNLKNLDRLTRRDEVKFVIGNRNDFTFAKRLIRRIVKDPATKPPSSPRSIHLAPVFGALDPRELAQWILEDRLPVHLQLQIHKLLWPPNTRGV
ncbi:MAG: radical SAM protein [Deltaproteobacteria bacterium]|nr:radical SAM protein [Deltaproteobacteria bacterium]